MFFHTRRMPDGSPRTNPKEAYPDILDQRFRQECAWAMGYVMLLERHLNDLKQRCKECPYRNQEGSGCSLETTD